MPFHIRLLEKNELAQSAALVRLAFADVAARFGLTKENCPSNGAFLEDARLAAEYDAGVAMFGLFLENGPQAGFVALKERSNGLCYLEKMAVPPEHRRRGLGGALLAHALNAAARRGFHTVSIGIISDNAPLARWYAARGFRPGKAKIFDNLPFAVLFMECDLGARKRTMRPQPG